MARILTLPHVSRLRVLLALLSALAACKSPSGSPAPAAKASGAPVPAPAPSPAPAPAPAAVVDLLLETDAKITVSSRVDNPTDYPEHLVDGRPETAWNGKTGDLHGWIEVVLPPEVRVTSLAITSGFDKKKDKDDLFTMNHRIAKVRILRDGAVVKDATLDTSRRDLQHIPISLDGTGGTWRIEVLETVPGTKKEWKELVVSDLKMYGVAGAARLPSPRLPKVAVAPGSTPPPAPLTGVDAVVGEGRFATSLRALCDGFTVDMTRAIRAEVPGSTIKGPFCRPVTPTPTFEGSLPLGWNAVHAVELERFFGNFVSTTSHLVIEGSDGTFTIGPRYAHHDDLGCFSTPVQLTQAFRLARRGAQSWLVVSRTQIVPHYVESDNSIETTSSTLRYEALVCALGGTKATCPESFTRLETRELDDRESKAITSKPDLRWPKLEVDGGVTGAAEPLEAPLNAPLKR